jgi:hypothetical protein
VKKKSKLAAMARSKPLAPEKASGDDRECKHQGDDL